MSINIAVLSGRLGKDPEFRTLAGGQSVCNFRLATSDSWKDASGVKQERTEWHSIVVWGGQAKACSEYLRKGSQVLVEGKIQTREWENKRSGSKSYITEIKALHVEFIGGGKAKREPFIEPDQNTMSMGVPSNFSDDFDKIQPSFTENDIPF